MCMKFSDYRQSIESYCLLNHLDFNKAMKMVKGCGSQDIILQYHNPEKGTSGLLDETPMPVVLRIVKNNDNELVFEQTEYTKKYLAN